MNLQYVTAEPSDIPVIFDQAKMLIDRYEDLTSIDYDQVLSWVRRKITQSISQYHCVLCSGCKCAYYHLCEDGELDDLYVLPEFQNRGIGTKILERCIAQSPKPLYLYVFSRNQRAIALYERFGFVPAERVGQTRLILRRNG